MSAMSTTPSPVPTRITFDPPAASHAPSRLQRAATTLIGSGVLGAAVVGSFLAGHHLAGTPVVAAAPTPTAIPGPPRQTCYLGMTETREGETGAMMVRFVGVHAAADCQDMAAGASKVLGHGTAEIVDSLPALRGMQFCNQLQADGVSVTVWASGVSPRDESSANGACQALRNR
jgi:hypothetical protein